MDLRNGLTVKAFLRIRNYISVIFLSIKKNHKLKVIQIHCIGLVDLNMVLLRARINKN